MEGPRLETTAADDESAVIARFRPPRREWGRQQEFAPLSWLLCWRRCSPRRRGFQAQTWGSSGARELVVGTKVAAPFAMKEEDSTWRGISIELWRRIANQMHLRYRFEETSLTV